MIVDVGVQDPERRFFACKQSTLREIFFSGIERVSSLSCGLNGLIEKQELLNKDSPCNDTGCNISVSTLK